MLDVATDRCFAEVESFSKTSTVSANEDYKIQFVTLG